MNACTCDHNVRSLCPAKIAKEMAIFLNKVVILAIGLAAIHNVAMEVPHSTGSQHEGPRLLWAVEAVPGVAHQLHAIAKGVFRCPVRAPEGPSLVAETLVAHLHHVLHGGILGDSSIGAVAFEEAVAAVVLRRELAVQAGKGLLVQDARGLRELAGRAAGDEGQELGRGAPALQSGLSVRGEALGVEPELLLREVDQLAVEGGPAEVRVGCAVQLRVGGRATLLEPVQQRQPATGQSRRLGLLPVRLHFVLEQSQMVFRARAARVQLEADLPLYMSTMADCKG
mmetsp:Transcript_30986/g.88832  ORF Transcript_30986/g.88832 Transcript_30986/m.88832 type:complete len:283 (+) Transcript_30986:39-887(+)